MRVFLICAFTTSIAVISCNNNKADNSFTADSTVTRKTMVDPSLYQIVKIEPYETDKKAQINIYAFLKSGEITEGSLKATLNDIYITFKSYDNFENFTSPTFIAIYLYTSIEKANTMREAWIAMATKTPNDSEPRLSIDDMKLTALSGLNDNKESTDEIKYKEINTYLNKRHIDLCTIYKNLYDLEGESIKQADIKFPGFGIEHTEYSTKWYKVEKAKLFKKHEINDSLSTSITVFGMSYCK